MRKGERITHLYPGKHGFNTNTVVDILEDSVASPRFRCCVTPEVFGDTSVLLKHPQSVV